MRFLLCWNSPSNWTVTKEWLTRLWCICKIPYEDNHSLSNWKAKQTRIFIFLFSLVDLETAGRRSVTWTMYTVLPACSNWYSVKGQPLSNRKFVGEIRAGCILKDNCWKTVFTVDIGLIFFWFCFCFCFVLTISGSILAFAMWDIFVYPALEMWIFTIPFIYPLHFTRKWIISKLL